MRIKESAVQQDGIIYTGNRHSNCFRKMQELGIKTKPRPYHIQGFITEDGKFVTRQEAFKIALESGQIKRKNPMPEDILTSEDLY